MFEFIYIAVGSNISRALDRCVNAVRQCTQWIRKCFKTLPHLSQCLPDLFVQTGGFNTRRGKTPHHTQSDTFCYPSGPSVAYQHLEFSLQIMLVTCSCLCSLWDCSVQLYFM